MDVINIRYELNKNNMANAAKTQTKKAVQGAGLHKYIATGGTAKGYKGSKGMEKSK